MSERKAFLLRLPPELYDALQRIASAELRSINAQIEMMLRESVRIQKAIPNSHPRDSQDS